MEKVQNTEYVLLAHVARRARWAYNYSMAQPPASVVRLSGINFSFKRLFSKTTSLISTKFGRKYLLGMGIQMCSNQGGGPLRDHLTDQKVKYW